MNDININNETLYHNLLKDPIAVGDTVRVLATQVNQDSTDRQQIIGKTYKVCSVQIFNNTKIYKLDIPGKSSTGFMQDLVFHENDLCKIDPSLNDIIDSVYAMAEIYKLFPQYGGMITDDEWADTDITKHYINRLRSGSLYIDATNSHYHYIAFHTQEQALSFMNEHADLCYDFLHCPR